jgi:antibiotic biosynthesis monooxygenase (ABM) superfamily enzyme
MTRKQCITGIAAALASAVMGKGATNHPISLHCDLAVDPGKEKQMLSAFRSSFLPTARKHPGYIDVKLLKLASAIEGKLAAGVNYRFVITYESEALRQKWIASADHQRVWGPLEATLTNKKFSITLFDDVTQA